MLTAGTLHKLPRVRHGFLTREGGVSEGLYASLNCGVGSNDNPAHVRENRRRAAEAFGLGAERLVTLYQVHSSEVIQVDTPWTDDARPKGDAMVTRTPSIALGILTADCAPVLLADTEAGVIGAAHAGWKGALGGVVERTVEAMIVLGAERARIRAAVGPCIGQDSYEVSPEFPTPFLKQSPRNAGFFRHNRDSGRPHFDLAGYAASRAAEAGVQKVDILEHDTCGEPERFFSYRRACLAGEPDYGRGLSVITLER